MQILQVIVGLVQDFTLSEVKNIERVIVKSKSTSKLWILFNLIYHKKYSEQEDLIRKIYKEKSVKSNSLT